MKTENVNSSPDCLCDLCHIIFGKKTMVSVAVNFPSTLVFVAMLGGIIFTVVCLPFSVRA